MAKSTVDLEAISNLRRATLIARLKDATGHCRYTSVYTGNDVAQVAKYYETILRKMQAAK